MNLAALLIHPTVDPHDLEWQDCAICPQVDPDIWFPEKGGSTREAKKVCQGCEVRIQCLAYALEHDERFGIWGGLSERERRRLQRGEDVTPAMGHGGHQPSSACYQRGCRRPECCEAKATYERELRQRHGAKPRWAASQ